MTENQQSPMFLHRIDELITLYRDGLLHNTLPFWIEHCVDREVGGFFCALDRDGTVIDTDKGLWQHGRFTWLLSTLYSQVEPREEWLALAKHGLDFIRRYGFDGDGRMFFHVTRDGRPVRKRRYIFTEAFGVAALAAYAKATGDEQARQEAIDLFDLIARYLTTPGLLPPKFNTDVRPAKGMAVPMIMIATSQIMRDAVEDPALYQTWIDQSIAEIERDFMKPEFEAVLETVGPNGEFIEHFDGRLLNPGHAIEASWFILTEAKYRGNDPHLIQLGTTILDWMWQWGWDQQYGGIIYFRDVKGLPVQEYWQDMKFWWPQNEAIIATLMAYQMTGDQKYARWHQMIHDWAYAHFPDREHGEWFGYLHRDGSVSVPLKGNLWKGPFHLPRMQLVCWQMLVNG
ncbi:MAG: AGE family epimerase/isomerase [Chloroflexota bacterium]|nr:AGE family epimerase/isomerase [Chloroflexota bacterium]